MNRKLYTVSAALLIVTSVILIITAGIASNDSVKTNPAKRFLLFSPYIDFKEKRFDWRGLIVPAALCHSRVTDNSQVVVFDLPYEFSRSFNTAKPVNPDDYGRMISHIEKIILSSIGSEIFAFDSQAEALKRGFPDYVKKSTGVRISKIHIDGLASPEAETAGSEQPGSIDKKNLVLAGYRATHSGKALEDVLIKLGFSYPKGEVTFENSEIQFSESEISRLGEIASQTGRTQIFALLTDYEDGKITDVKIKSKLDDIVGSKRKVSVFMNLADRKQRIVIIPLPLLILICILLWSMYSRSETVRRRKKEKARSRPETAGVPDKPQISSQKKTAPAGSPADPAPSSSGIQTESKNPFSQTPDLRPDAAGDLVGRSVLVKEMDRYISDVIYDINTNFEFYRDIIHAYRRRDLSVSRAAIDLLARDMLILWMEHDNRNRTNLNEQPEDQFENKAQITYAVLHAVVFRRYILDMRKSGAEKAPESDDVTSIAWDELRRYNELI